MHGSLDEFEREFLNAREETVEIKELLKNRFNETDMVKDVMLKKQIEELHEAHATTVRALKKLVTKNKKYTVADKENKNERIEKLQANMQVLWEMFQY